MLLIKYWERVWLRYCRRSPQSHQFILDRCNPSQHHCCGFSKNRTQLRGFSGLRHPPPNCTMFYRWDSTEWGFFFIANGSHRWSASVGTAVGISDLCSRFSYNEDEENEKDAAKLLLVVLDKHTALRLFSQCTLHKLPHLLGSEVMYCFQETDY